MFSKPLIELLSTDEGEVDDVALISMDSKGIDIRVRQGAQVQPSEVFYMVLCFIVHLYMLSWLLLFLKGHCGKIKCLGRVLQFNIQRVAFEVDHSVETLDEAMEALRRIISKSRWHTKSSILRHP